MPQSIQQVQPPLGFLPQSFNPLVYQIYRLLLPWWIRYQLKIARIQVDNIELLVDLYRQFQNRKVRLLLAFRHPSTDDPFAMSYLIAQALPRAAREQGVKLRSPVHSYFIYDRGIPLWAGSFVTWLFPKLGGTSIQRGKVDMVALKAARTLLANGDYPLAAAPEGATNGHNEIVSPLEPGVAQLGFWCVEDLVKAGRSETVLIVPIGIRYHYLTEPWTAMEQLLGELEADSGLASPPASPASPTSRAADRTEILYQRLLRLTEHLLDLGEAFYQRYYHQTFPPLPAGNGVTPEPATAATSAKTILMARLRRLLEVALQVAEAYFDLPAKGTLEDRCRRLEQAGWDRIFREDLAALSPLERGLADWLAEEASLQLWHMRLAERLTAVTGEYIQAQPTASRFAETVLILWRVVTWLKGGDPAQTPNLGQRWVQMQIGEPLSVSDRWETYQSSRRHAKQAVIDLTQDLKMALENMIH